MPLFLKLLFIRHAQSTGNVEKRMQGQGDFPLTELGREQAGKLAQRLLAEGWLPSHVYSSPLQRTVQTTQILLEQFRLAALPAKISDLSDLTDAGMAVVDFLEPLVEYAEALMEHQNGILQGLTWAEAVARYPALCRELEASPDWLPIPQAETLEAARQRSRQFIQQVLEQHKNGDRLWILTHSWILQHLIAELLGCDRSWRLPAHNTSLFEFWIDQTRWHCTNSNRYNTDLWQIRRLNDYQHLSES